MFESIKKPYVSVRPGEEVRVHRNLNPVRMNDGRTHEGLWVVRVKRSGKYIHAGYRLAVSISHCTPHATPGGIKRIEKRGRRDVVAWIDGRYVSDSATTDAPTGTPVHYNPYRRHDFHTMDGQHYAGSNNAAFPQGCTHFIAS